MTENEILIDCAEKRISIVEAVFRLEEVGLEPHEAIALAIGWMDFIAECGPLQ